MVCLFLYSITKKKSSQKILITKKKSNLEILFKKCKRKAKEQKQSISEFWYTKTLLK